MIVVSDASPLSYAQQIGLLPLLHALYGEIVIPPMVERELLAAPELHAELDWSLIRIAPPKATEQVESLLDELDPGAKVKPSLWRWNSKPICF